MNERKKPRKLEAAQGRVNFVWRGVPGLLISLSAVAALLLAGCRTGGSPAPVDGLSRDWPTLLGDHARVAAAHESPPEHVADAWRTDVGRGLTSPLLVDGPILLAATGNERVAAISTQTGEAYWERRIQGAITGGLVRQGGTLFVPTDEEEGLVSALDVRTGKTRWEEVVGSSSVAPLVIDDVLYIATDRGGLFALDADSGERIWQTRLAGRAAGTPVAYGNTLLLTTTADSLFRFDRQTGEITGRAPLPAGASAPPALRDNRFFLPLLSGELLVADAADLGILGRHNLGEPVLAAPLATADGSVYLLTRTGVVWRLPPNQGEPEQLASLGSATGASLTLANDKLLVGMLDGTLFLLRADGSVVWKKRLGQSIVAPVSVNDGAIYVPLRAGTVVKLVEP